MRARYLLDTEDWGGEVPEWGDRAKADQIRATLQTIWHRADSRLP